MPPEAELPWHPMLVHFPIALYVSALILETLSWVFKRPALHETALRVGLLAVIFTPLVVRTGLMEAQEHNLHQPVVDLHRTFALWTMWVSLAALGILVIFYKYQKNFFRVVFILFLLVVVVLVSLAAYNGGRLVYEYGIADHHPWPRDPR